jgi:acyl-homoserine lactone acylase PvdQ
MASFPGPKVHRSNRRKLGKGQHVQAPAANITAAVATTVVTLTFSVPVVVNGPIVATTTNGTLVSSAQTSPTTATLTFSLTQATATVTVPGGQAAISTFQGGSNAPFVETF